MRVSSGPWKPWYESSGPWQPLTSYNTLPKALKTLKSFSDFHGVPEICLSVKRIELTIKYWKTVMQKLYILHKQRSGP